jgi:hypothetical protein
VIGDGNVGGKELNTRKSGGRSLISQVNGLHGQY